VLELNGDVDERKVEIPRSGEALSVSDLELPRRRYRETVRRLFIYLSRGMDSINPSARSRMIYSRGL